MNIIRFSYKGTLSWQLDNMLWGIVLQGGPFVEIFSAQGKDPTHGWKVGSGIKREYEKDVKGFLYCLEGSTTTTKLQLPKGKGLSLSRQL